MLPLVFSVSCNQQEETKTSKVKAQDDFFKYVNQDWLDKAEIPADKGRWGSFDELRENNNKIVLDVLEKATKSGKYGEGTDQKKAADFYQIGMDSALAEKHGLTPLMPFIEKIDAIKNKKDLQEYLAFQETYGGGAFFGFSVFADLKNSDVNAAYLGSGGLGLPDAEYYLKKGTKAVETINKYKEYMESMFEQLEYDESLAHGISMMIINLETDLARATLDKVAQRNVDTLYNKMTVKELQKLAPSVKWNKYFKDLGANDVEEIIVMEPLFLKAYDSLVNVRDISDIREYLKWQLINNSAPYMSDSFVNPNFSFFGTYLRGRKEISPRWKRVLGTTNRFLGEAIGQLYVDEVFPPEAKAKTLAMVENIKEAFGERVQGLDWMSDATKEKALEKLAAFRVKIGYPDQWKDYSGLTVEVDENASFVGNVMSGLKYNFERDLKKLGKPVDKNEWRMNPQTVNAYYSPLANEIVFPAGILQPPFYDYKLDEAMNFGGIGAVIGHEISHGFDDQGSRFDAKGNMSNWWTDEDNKKFKERTGMLVDQYSNFKPFEDLAVNGEFTLGENIGDLGGINVAYDGLQRFLSKNGRPENIDGQTPEQRFFVSWATIWRTKYSDEALRTQIKTNPHSPGMYRANGPLQNMPEFYKAFDVKEGDKMYKKEEDRVKIW